MDYCFGKHRLCRLCDSLLALLCSRAFPVRQPGRSFVFIICWGKLGENPLVIENEYSFSARKLSISNSIIEWGPIF